jgi:plasmid stabilization system protein ParE
VTPKPVRLHPAALAEAEAAFAWYCERSESAAGRFLDELDWAIARISQQPEIYPPFEAGTRRIRLPHFPYLVIFRAVGDSLEVIAVAHGRRRPGYWRQRLTKD